MRDLPDYSLRVVPDDPREMIVAGELWFADDLRLPIELPGGFRLVEMTPGMRELFDVLAEDRHELGWSERQRLNDRNVAVIGAYSGELPGVLDRGENDAQVRLLAVANVLRIAAGTDISLSSVVCYHGHGSDRMHRRSYGFPRNEPTRTTPLTAAGLARAFMVFPRYANTMIGDTGNERVASSPMRAALLLHHVAVRTWAGPVFRSGKLLAHVAALEALVGPENGFARQDFIRRVPAFLSDEHRASPVTKKLLDRAYEARSRFAHGDPPLDVDPGLIRELESVVELALSGALLDDAAFDLLSQPMEASVLRGKRREFFASRTVEELSATERVRRLCARPADSLNKLLRELPQDTADQVRAECNRLNARVAEILGD